jgi:predicted MFS family arabinose efflux permease
LLLAVLFTALFLGGAYVLYIFLAPFAEARYGLGRDGVTALLLTFGLGAVVGNAVGGWLTDRIGPDRTLIVLGCAQAVTISAITVFSWPGWALFAVVGAWSVACWAFMVPQQARLANLAPPLTPVLFALNAAAIYLGGSIGSISGGAVLRQSGYVALGPAGAVLVLAGLGTLFLVARMRRSLSDSAA